MDTIEKTNPNICNVCQKPRLQYAFSAVDYITGDNFELWLCPDCQAMTTIPQLNDLELQKYYQGVYYGRRKSFIDQIINNERIKKIKKLKPANAAPAILDIGCGNGLFLNGLKKLGWKISGTELAPESHVHPNVLPFVCNKPVDECMFADESFDIITMWHTLEHFTDPMKYLHEANRLLKTGGVLVIEVPNFKSWQSRLTGKYWSPLEVPRHRTHFSPEALTIFLKKTGFQPIKIIYGNFFYNTFEFTQSSLNVVCKQKKVLFNLLNGKFSASVNGMRSIFDIFITITLTPVLSIISLILFFIEITTKHGGTMRFYAKKM